MFCQCISAKTEMLVVHSHLHEEGIAAAQWLSSLSERSAMISRGRANEACGKSYVVMLIFAIYYLKE